MATTPPDEISVLSHGLASELQGLSWIQVKETQTQTLSHKGKGCPLSTRSSFQEGWLWTHWVTWLRCCPRDTPPSAFPHSAHGLVSPS